MTIDLWRRPCGMSDAADQAGRLRDLPTDVAALARIVQGLLMHLHIASSYGVALTPQQQAAVHRRSASEILSGIIGQDARGLVEARPAAERTVGVCRHFTLLHVAMLRTQGIPARARCGFAAYFESGKFIDHWVTEYQDPVRDRWVLADAQLDDHQRRLFRIDFDPLDVPRDQFLVAGEAWHLCRTGKADPNAFGILDMYGLWFIADNVIRDIAALNNHEMLPWDVWGAMSGPDAAIDQGLVERLAGLSREPDHDVADLERAYRDPRVAVPSSVFNALLDQPEPVR
ncbi:MAG: transglutaminase-like domain-containing protein [Pseudomonadota bacterium]